MIRSLVKLSATVAILAVFLCLVGNTEANYKNAPMNGIMFGKRGPSGNLFLTKFIFIIY